MSVLEDARREAEECHGSANIGRPEDCFYSRVVAALEAAECVIESWQETLDGPPDFSTMKALEQSLRVVP